eukprot:401787_1
MTSNVSVIWMIISLLYPTWIRGEPIMVIPAASKPNGNLITISGGEINVNGCGVVIQWDHGLPHHEMEGACKAALGSEWTWGNSQAHTVYVPQLRNNQHHSWPQVISGCYSSTSYFTVGPHGNVFGEADIDDSGGKYICACYYMRGDSNTASSDDDFTCYVDTGGFGIGWSIDCDWSGVYREKCYCPANQINFSKLNACVLCTKDGNKCSGDNPTIGGSLSGGCNWGCYLARYPNLRAAYGSDFGAAEQHYLIFGINEGRYCKCDAHDSCNWDCYLNNNVDLKNSFGDKNTGQMLAAKHYLDGGINEGRNCRCNTNDNCNWSCYLNNYVDLNNAFGGQQALAAQHYSQFGKAENRNCQCVASNIPFYNIAIFISLIITMLAFNIYCCMGCMGYNIVNCRSGKNGFSSVKQVDDYDNDNDTQL